VTAAADGAGGRDRRASPELRPAVQAGYSTLLAVLDKAGRRDLLEPISGLPRVDDVLREQPAHVARLLDIAWELRTSAEFRSLFVRTGATDPVTERDQPIAPCDLTFNQIIRAHLYGAARLAFDKRERAWAERRARREQARRREKRAQEAGKTLQGRLVGSLRTMLDSGEGEAVDPEPYRARYPGHGLYLVLKPHLKENWQFAFIEHYARFGTAQARALAHLIGRVRSAKRLEAFIGLSVDDIGLIRTVARTFGEVRLGVELDHGPEWQMTKQAKEEHAAISEQLSALESIVFDTILLNHPGAVDRIRDLNAAAARTVRRLAPVFGDELWAVMDHQQDLENARNMPDHLLPVLGRLSRHCPPEISTILGHIREHALAKDLMALVRQHFSDDDLARYLSDPSRKAVWNALPTKFNNAFPYQRDAMSGGSLRNIDDLNTVARALYHALEQGRTEGL
jgi:hypothetical protein